MTCIACCSECSPKCLESVGSESSPIRSFDAPLQFTQNGVLHSPGSSQGSPGPNPAPVSSDDGSLSPSLTGSTQVSLSSTKHPFCL